MPGMVQISFGHENTRVDVDQLVAILRRIVRGEYQGNYRADPGSGDYIPVGYQERWSDYFSLESRSYRIPVAEREPLVHPNLGQGRFVFKSKPKSPHKSRKTNCQ